MDDIKFQILEDVANVGAVDAELGIIRGVSLISTPEAKGHNISIDRKSIESFYDAVNGKPIKAYYTHSPANEALDSIGIWQNFEIKEDGEYTKLTADFSALDAWKQNNKKDYEMLFELASKAPEAFGVSAEFSAKTIVYGEDGEEEEYQEGEDDDVEKFARAIEVSAFSIVAQPAANPTGLFAKGEEQVALSLVQATERKLELELELQQSKDCVEKLSSELDSKELLIKETQTELEAKSEELKLWKSRYAEAVAESGSEPVQVVEQVELSFHEKLARCSSNKEKQKLYEQNMDYLMYNWSNLKTN